MLAGTVCCEVESVNLQPLVQQNFAHKVFVLESQITLIWKVYKK